MPFELSRWRGRCCICGGRESKKSLAKGQSHKEVIVTQLRDRMLEELERRNYSPGTARRYLHAVQQFASLRKTGQKGKRKENGYWSDGIGNASDKCQ
jgi:hypothetical protein